VKHHNIITANIAIVKHPNIITAIIDIVQHSSGMAQP
jgi:hypothetical protein